MLKINKEETASRLWNARAEMERLAEIYLDAYNRYIDIDSEYKTKKAEATLRAEGKTASIRSANALIQVSREYVDRIKAKIALEKADVDRDSHRLYYRVLSSVLSAAGSDAPLYPIQDRIPDPLGEVDRAWKNLLKADIEMKKAVEGYLQAEADYELTKALKVASGIEGKNEEERKARLALDPEVQEKKKVLDDAKKELERAEVSRQIARDNLRFWLSYMRSLGLDESGVDDPGRIVRR